MVKTIVTLSIFLIIWSGTFYAQDLTKSNIFSSIDAASITPGNPESQSYTSNITSAGFASGSNLKDANSSSDELNIHLKSNAHMGDVVEAGLTTFGENLFGSQCNKVHSARFFNPQYRLAVGDEINVQMWGAYQFTDKLNIDTQGNIFIPEVGPIKIAGIENQNLNQVIQNHVKKAFKQGVNIYADLVTAQPVQVYVTGYVRAPGLYDGLSSDSIIYYLCEAGGINLEEGSFRNIDIVRHGKKIRDIDLYQFLIFGNIDTFQLHQGDTIVVHPEKYHISVAGDIKKPYQYELLTPATSLAEIIKLANIQPTATYVRIQRNQGLKPTFLYHNLKNPLSIDIKSGDRVSFVADKEQHQVVVFVTGEVKGPHQYVIAHGTNIQSFIQNLQLKSEANIQNIQLFRESVAKQQKDALNASLSRLRRQSMTGETLSDDDAKMQATRSQLISQFVNDAANIQTKGQVVLGSPKRWNKVLLENNDVINIPNHSSVVTISGDVVNSLSMNLNPHYRLQDYIEAAGGFQKTANKKELLVMRQNGEAKLIKNTQRNNSHVVLQGGDQLVILPRETENGIKVTGMMSSILYQLAIAARVAMRI